LGGGGGGGPPRLYRTGDWARYGREGAIEFLGRRDQQVKLRGFRIELGEIEAALCGQEQVRQAVVLAHKQPNGEKRLVAYVACEAGAEISSSELRGRLKERLPEYMVPAAFVWLASLPLTPNGKVDRKALIEPDYQASEWEYVAPRTEVEELLCGVWAEVLGLDRVGIHDNFFELGGHSLLATKLITRIRALFTIEMPLQSVFDLKTIAELAELVEKAKSDGAGLKDAPIPRLKRELHRSEVLLGLEQ
jgi:nonribosomal peptide synthetase DhbF